MKSTKTLPFAVLAVSVLLSVFSHSTFAADPKPEGKKRNSSGYDDSILQGMDHGPFYSGVFNGRDISLKGIAVKLDGGNAGIVFDTLTLRYGDGWTGGFIQI